MRLKNGGLEGKALILVYKLFSFVLQADPANFVSAGDFGSVIDAFVLLLLLSNARSQYSVF